MTASVPCLRWTSSREAQDDYFELITADQCLVAYNDIVQYGTIHPIHPFPGIDQTSLVDAASGFD